MYDIVRSDSEIDEQLNKAMEGQDQGSRYPGMSFEEGVQGTIDWLTGVTDEPPFED